MSKELYLSNSNDFYLSLSSETIMLKILMKMNAYTLSNFYVIFSKILMAIFFDYTLILFHEYILIMYSRIQIRY
jgi:hypothetical protein